MSKAAVQLSTRDHAVAYLTALLDRVGEEAEHTRSAPGEAGIHDLRVAIRRLLSCLKVFEQFTDVTNLKKVRRRLKKVMKHAAAVRDCDIVLGLLAESGVYAPAARMKLLQKRTSAARLLIQDLAKWKRQGSVKRWKRGLFRHASPSADGDWDGAAGARDSARLRLPELTAGFFQKGVRALGPSGGPEDGTLHEFRLDTKRLRYTLEAFLSTYGRGLPSRLEQLKEVQTLLGEINDCDTTRELIIPKTGNRHAWHRRLSAYLQQRDAMRRQDLAAVWEDRFSESKRKSWLTYLAK